MRRALIAALLLTLAALLAAPASHGFAHPVGNLSTNRYSGIQLSPRQLRLRYVVDFAEIPTIQELARLDSNHDGQVTAEERSAYLESKAGQLMPGLHLHLDGSPVSLELVSSDLQLQPGIAGLQTLRVILDMVANIAPPPGRPVALSYQDSNYQPRVGWGEIVLRAGDGVEIADSTAPSIDPTNELRTYPTDMLSNPPDHREAHATLVVAGTARGTGDSGIQKGVPSLLGAMLGALLGLPGLLSSWFDPLVSPLAARGQSLPLDAASGRLGALGTLLALILAAIWGAAHALSPGHGKTIVAAYLVGARGTARHALYLGLTVTATHTLGIYALGLVTLFATRFVMPEVLYPWLALLSSLGVAGMGATLAVARARRLMAGGRLAHDHHHSHEDHHHEQSHSHLPPGIEGEKVTWRSLLALGVAGGILPCPSALVLLLGSIALGQVAFGLILVAAFSLGLAGVLTTVGVVFVYARGLVSRRLPSVGLGSAARLFRVAPLGSALLILAAGLAMTLQALGLAGIVRL